MSYPSSIPGLDPIHQGKVRDTFATVDPEVLLLVATDRISTHNVVHASLVPLKGQILTALTVFWTEVLCEDDIPHHILASGQDIYDFLPMTDQPYPEDLHLRAVAVRKLDMLPFELIFRGRMAGSLWSEYYSKGIPNPYGLELPSELELMSPFDSPIFTPTEKSETDDPVRASDIRQAYPAHVGMAEELYRRGIRYALSRGIEIIDTKIEVGIDQYGRVCVGDEILTLDSSRFVQSADIVIGKNPPWADKQIVRDEAELIWGGKKKGSPIAFSKDTIRQAQDMYLRVFHQLTGMSLGEFQQKYF